MGFRKMIAGNTALRLVTTEELSSRPAGRGLSPETRLSEFFEAYFVPVHLRSTMADANTVAEYRTAMRFWIRYTWDPPLRLIDNLACAAFVEEDLAAETAGRTGVRSPNTVRKHCTALQMVLNLAGPQTKQHPQAASAYGLFGEDPYGRPRQVPWFQKPPEREKPPDDVLAIEEIERLLGACPRAVKPVVPECSAWKWWDSFIRFDYNTGLRRRGMLQFRRSWVKRQGDWGRIELPGRASKKGRPKLIFASPAALAIMDAMPTGDLVFPWPQSLVSFNRYRKKLWQMAGLPPDRKLHSLRKAIGSELFSLDPKAAQLQLGHESESTTRRSYASAAARASVLAERIGPAMRRIPQPKTCGRQKTLF